MKERLITSLKRFRAKKNVWGFVSQHQTVDGSHFDDRHPPVSCSATVSPSTRLKTRSVERDVVRLNRRQQQQQPRRQLLPYLPKVLPNLCHLINTSSFRTLAYLNFFSPYLLSYLFMLVEASTKGIRTGLALLKTKYTLCQKHILKYFKILVVFRKFQLSTETLNNLNLLKNFTSIG